MPARDDNREATLGPLLAAVCSMTVEWCGRLDESAEDFDAYLELATCLCSALPEQAKAWLRFVLPHFWGENPPTWAGRILDALRPVIGGLDMDVWGELLDGLPDA